VDPFGVTCDPRLYVPRASCELALTALARGLAQGRRVLALSGPAGLGKTLLLRVLEKRVSTIRCVALPYPALGLAELAHCALEALGGGSGAGDHVAALAERARAEARSGRPLLLLLDDAGALPLATARALRGLVDSLGGALRVVVAATDEARTPSVIAALGDDVLDVRLHQPMPAAELRHYLRERLLLAGSRARLADAQIAWIAEEAAGVPRTANMLASWLLRPHAQRPVLLSGPEPTAADAAPKPGAPRSGTPGSTATQKAARERSRRQRRRARRRHARR
jgi:type II secretory pathway predicted ATPase ExeA